MAVRRKIEDSGLLFGPTSKDEIVAAELWYVQTPELNGKPFYHLGFDEQKKPALMMDGVPLPTTMMDRSENSMSGRVSGSVLASPSTCAMRGTI